MAKIIVLEDDADFSFLLAQILQNHGHEVESRRSASEVRALMEQGSYDLLICDIFIYKGGEIVSDGGLALIGWIRTASFAPGNERFVGFPIIAVSGATKLPGNSNILDIATSVGAKYTLSKPFSDRELLDTVNLALKTAETVQ